MADTSNGEGMQSVSDNKDTTEVSRTKELERETSSTVVMEENGTQDTISQKDEQNLFKSKDTGCSEVISSCEPGDENDCNAEIETTEVQESIETVDKPSNEIMKEYPKEHDEFGNFAVTSENKVSLIHENPNEDLKETDTNEKCKESDSMNIRKMFPTKNMTDTDVKLDCQVMQEQERSSDAVSSIDTNIERSNKEDDMTLTDNVENAALEERTISNDEMSVDTEAHVSGNGDQDVEKNLKNMADEQKLLDTKKVCSVHDDVEMEDIVSSEKVQTTEEETKLVEDFRDSTAVKEVDTIKQNLVHSMDTTEQLNENLDHHGVEDLNNVVEKGDNVEDCKEKGNMSHVVEKGENVVDCDDDKNCTSAVEKGENVEACMDEENLSDVVEKGENVEACMDEENLSDVVEKGENVEACMDEENLSNVVEKGENVEACMDEGTLSNVVEKGENLEDCEDEAEKVMDDKEHLEDTTIDAENLEHLNNDSNHTSDSQCSLQKETSVKVDSKLETEGVVNTKIDKNEDRVEIDEENVLNSIADEKQASNNITDNKTMEENVILEDVSTNTSKEEGGKTTQSSLDSKESTREEITKSTRDDAITLDQVDSKKDDTGISTGETVTIVDDDIHVDKPNESKSLDKQPSKSQQKTDLSKESTSKSKTPQKCIVCQKVGKCKYNIVRNGDIKHLCDDKCFKMFRGNPTSYLKGKHEANGTLLNNTASSVCGFCQSPVPVNKIGTFTLKTGSENKMFCTSECRNEFKSKQKKCSFCSTDIGNSPSAIVAPVQNGSFLDFCSINCHSKYEKNTTEKQVSKDEDIEIVGTSKTSKTTSSGVTTRGATSMSKCSVCGKNSTIKHEVTFNKIHHKLCSDPCFAAFRYANKLSMTACDSCSKFCQGENNVHSIQFMGQTKKFCNPTCMNTFKTKNQKITPCAWCQSKKSNFDMVERVDANSKTQLFCSLNCLSLYRVNLQATSNQNVTCDQCHKFAPAQYHLTMSDASVRNFCAYNCVMAFQSKFQQPQTGTGRGQVSSRQSSVTTNATANTATKGRGKGGSRVSARGT